ncbi:hypothetical protein ACLB2K_003149 [Fragaria x ananassa]
MVIIKESSPTYKYHVFLSFRGEDTRNNFTGHLYSALRDKGIFTFMDDQLIRGEEISPALIQAIEQSKISIVVLSEHYASSKWCLDELVKILDCKEKIQQIVLPVFFKVDPSDVRNHRGSFGEGLANLERKFKDQDQVQEWKTALFKAASLSGWPLDEHHSESSIIGEIVAHISKEHVNSTDLDVAEYQVGIQHRVQAIQKLLGVEGRDVHMVGIWGAGGIGKTTIAKAVYNSIAQKFDGSCFLENVRENSEGTRGLVELQKILLREILKEREVEVTSVARGISMIKERLQHKSVLLVLDDVSDMNQLNNLARQCSWFGTGSRIIITTRDKKLLRCHGVHPDLIYEVQELDSHDALELFSMNAFKRSRPLDDYAELTERAVRYAQGLPLVLTVLGSSLRGGSMELWEAALDGSESREIKDVLKISFDGLDHRVKEAFLDIACFFKGEDREHVIKIIKACGGEEHFINVLIEKALIRVGDGPMGPYPGDKIWMHDLIEEMGRDIVHEQSPDDPGNRSRLWFHEDVYRVLVDNIGTNNVRGIKVELPQDSDVLCLCATSFSSMKNLKLIIGRAGRYSGVVDGLPNSLRVIDWPDCPLQVLPSHTLPRELSVIHMPRSRIKVLGDVYYKRLMNLTSINLSFCRYLTKVSDLSGIPNLQSLILDSCENLVEVHPSVGFLHRLNCLDLSYCRRLETVPMEVRWKSMRSLLVPYCGRLENFINIVHEIASLKTLSLSDSGIKELHSWIGRCTSLEHLDLYGTPIKQLPSKIENLTSLTELKLSRTLLKELPCSIKGLTSLVTLDARGSLIEVLPSSIGDLTSLRKLKMSITPLKELPSSIGCLTSLRELDVSDTPLKELPSSIGCLTSLRKLYMIGTPLKELPSSIGCLTSLRKLYMIGTPLKELPSSIGNLTSLKELRLDYTLIEKLPPSVENLTSLKELWLDYTLIEKLPPSVENLTSLESLELSKTRLKELPSSIGNLTSLKKLRLNNTLIEKLPPSVGNLTSLESLELSKTPLKELPSSIGSLTSLRELDASETLIEGLPLSIGNLIGLELLRLRGCANLTNVPHSVYEGLQGLRELDLSWSPKLVTFPSRASGVVSSSSESLLLMLPTDSNNGHDHPGSLSDFLTNLDCKSTLQRLNLSGSSFDSLPACIGKFLNLDSLNLGRCKSLRDISELPPNLRYIELDDCVLLERFSKLSDILEQRDTPGLLSEMYLSNCNRLMDNLGIDLVSKMAKALPHQMVQAGVDQHVLSWDLILPSLLEIEVPKWFDRGEVDASVLPGHEPGDMCEILVRIPRNLKAEKIGFVVCVVFGITRRWPEPVLVTVVIDNKQYYGRCHYFEARATESSAHDHVLVCLICIAFKELELVDRVVRVMCHGYNGALLLKSFGVHLLANMQENDGDHVSGEYLAQERYRDGNASISDLENIDGAAVASLVSDDSFTGEVHDDHDEGEPERELHRPTKRFRWQ